jgi:hypothetical protein
VWFGFGRWFDPPSEEAEEGDDDSRGQEVPLLEDEAVAHDREREREHQRPVRRRRHVDAVRVEARGKVVAVGAVGAARGQPDQATFVVLGVLPVPVVVEARHDGNDREVVGGRR